MFSNFVLVIVWMNAFACIPEQANIHPSGLAPAVLQQVKLQGQVPPSSVLILPPVHQLRPQLNAQTTAQPNDEEQAIPNNTKWINQEFIIEVLSVSILVLSVFALLTLRLYSINRTKHKESLVKAGELEREANTNKKLTQLLNNIFESSLDGIIAFDSVRNEVGEIVDFKYKMVNQIAAEIIGIPVNTLLEQNMLELLPGNKSSGLFDAYKNTVESGKNFHTITYYRHDGIDKWFSINAVKNLDGFIVTFADVSEFKQNEELLLRKQEELELANQELEQFVYIASHDLKEPLRKVRAFGARLESGYADVLDDKCKDYIARMRSASDRMQALIDDLLKLSRASRGDTEMDLVDLNSVLSLVKDALSEQIAERHAIISSDTLPTIHANKSQMTQLFQNIISNAIKYVEDTKEPLVSIKVKNIILPIAEVPTSYWQIDISDNGIGFNNEYKTKIFEIFQRLHGRSEYSGTGIGLAICQKIVTNHQGYIFAESKEGEGATFSIQLPR